MTTTQEARETIYQTFASEIGLASSRVTFANEDYAPPVGQSWVRLTVLHQTGNQETLQEVGLRRFRREGIISVQIFVPIDIGLRDADDLLAVARNIFEGRTLSGPIWCTDANASEIGPSDGWYQFNIDTNFAYEEVR